MDQPAISERDVTEDVTSVDQELAALAALVDTLEPLDLTARRRVLDWACDRFYTCRKGRLPRR